jgi:hypothetical protein
MSVQPSRAETIRKSRRTAVLAAFLAGSGWISGVLADDTAPAKTSPAATSGITQTAATASSTTPAARHVLTYKFQPGHFVHYVGANRVQYTTQLGDQYTTESGPTQLEVGTFQSHQSNDTNTHFRVVKVDDDGGALIEPVVDRTRMTAQMHGKKPVIFDSASSGAVPPEFVAIRESIGRTVARFQVAPNGKLMKATIVDEAAPKSLRDAAERLDTRFPFLSLLPATPVSVGDKWREEYSVIVLNGGLKQPLPMRRIYELAAVADGIAVIKFKTLVLAAVNEPELEKQLIQQVPTGTIEFDIERGLVRSYTSVIDRTTINAFGPKSLLQVKGESTEKLVTGDPAEKVEASSSQPATSEAKP